MLPEGWKADRLEEHIDLLTGFPFASAEYVEKSETAVRLLRGDNISPSVLRWADAKYFPLEKAPAVERYYLREGDVVMALDRPLISSGLKCCIIRKADLPCLLVQRVARLRAKNRMVQEYLAQLVLTPKFVGHLLSRKTETAVPHVSPDDIRSYSAALPNVHEQRKIAKILGAWDGAISISEKLLANSYQQKLILANELFRSRNHWVVRAFGEVFRAANRRTAQVAAWGYLDSGRIPIVDQGQQLIAGYTDDDSVYVEPPVIVFGDHTRLVKWVDFPFRPGADGVQLLAPRMGIHPKFGYHLLARAAIPNLGYSRHMRFVKTLSFSIPPDQSEQSSIAAQLDLADDVIAALVAQIEKLKAEKRALMQQLLTGKRRVRLPTPELATA